MRSTRRGRLAKPIVECREDREDHLIPSRISGRREHDSLRTRAAPRNRASPARDCACAKHRDRGDPITQSGLTLQRLCGRRYVTPLFKCVFHTPLPSMTSSGQFTNAIVKQRREEREQVRTRSSYAENTLC